MEIYIITIMKRDSMKEITIPFNDWSKDRLKTGMKCATSRNKQYGEIGDIFRFDGFVYKITGIAHIPLWFIRAYLYESEGCETMDEFVEIWCQIHPIKGWDEHQLVWYHLFEIHTKEG